MGPQHPVDARRAAGRSPRSKARRRASAEPEIGYLHTGIEKSRRKSVLDAGVDGRSSGWTTSRRSSNALCYILAVEKLLGITDDIPRARAADRACCCASCTRIASHCVWLGTARHRPRRDLGLLLRFDLREQHPRPAPKLSGGARMHPELLAHRRLRRRLARRLPRRSSTR